MQVLPGRVRFGGYPLSLFAQLISNQVGRAVVDRTGLTGNWDFEMTYAPPPAQGPLPPGVELPPSDPDAPDLFTAVREQLGLKFESTKGPIEVLVIDSIEMATPD
jgi:bla regulator protein blaR1